MSDPQSPLPPESSSPSGQMDDVLPPDEPPVPATRFPQFDPNGSSNWFGSVVAGPRTPRPDAAAVAVPVAITSTTEPPAGTVVANRYTLFKRVGRGGMAVVFAARDNVLNRAVAVKLVRYDRVPPDQYADLARRFDREARITCQLQHPGIPAVHDLGTFPDGRPYMVMKLVKGKTLAELLKDRASLPSAGTVGTDLPHWLQTFEQICQTVGYAHSRGVIHRDLSPHNIMIGAFGEVQVMDWGLAKVLDRAPVAPQPETMTDTAEENFTVIDPVRSGATETPPEETNAAVGKFWYMPPEQAREEDVKRVDRRSDVFGLGAILCEILTGKPPYCSPRQDEQWAEAMLWLIEPGFKRLDACGADAELLALVKSCLAKKPDDRPTDAAAVAAAVGNYRAGVQDRLHRAELERASAEAKAAEAQALAAAEERAKQAAEARAVAEGMAADEARAKTAEQRKLSRMRLTFLAAAAAFVGLVVTGIWWREHEKYEQHLAQEAEDAQLARDQAARDADLAHRRADTERDVVGALNEARALRSYAAELAADPTHWGQVLTQAWAAHRRAESVLVTGAPSDSLAHMVDAERQALQIADKNRKFVARLDEIACFLGMSDAPKLVPKWYAAAFKENGLDLLDTKVHSAEACGDWIQCHPHADALLVALAAWLTVASPTETIRLEDIIPHAVSRVDAVFGKLQTAMLRPEALEALARDATVLKPRTLEFLAIRLRMASRDASATDLLRRGIERYPLDARLRLRFLDKVDDEDLTKVPADELEEAVLHLSAAVSMRPSSPAAHLKLGVALLRLHRHDDAVRAFRQAHVAFVRLRQSEPELLASDDDPLILVGLGDALVQRSVSVRRTDDLWEAAQHLHRAALRDPDRPERWFKLGNCLMLAGNMDGADVCFLNAIDAAPRTWADGHVGLGRTQLRRNDHDGAMYAFLLAVGRNPDHRAAQSELGKEFRARGLFVEAESAFARAVDPLSTDRRPINPEAWYCRGDCLGQTGKPDAALACYREAFRLGYRDPLFLRALVAALANKAGPVETVRAYEALFAADPLAPDHVMSRDRENAARAAMKAGMGQGPDLLSVTEQQKYREDALRWLEIERRICELELSTGTPANAARVRERMELWMTDSVFSTLRDPSMYLALPMKERQKWDRFWSDVNDLSERANGRKSGG